MTDETFHFVVLLESGTIRECVAAPACGRMFQAAGPATANERRPKLASARGITRSRPCEQNVWARPSKVCYWSKDVVVRVTVSLFSFYTLTSVCVRALPVGHL